jgi:hypothetical protein
MTTATLQAKTRILASAMVALAVVLTFAVPASAASSGHARITRGDVTAAFQARTTGGYLNGLHGHTVAAPVRGFLDGRISFFTDRTYCSADWHYLGVTLLGEGGRRTAGTYLKATSVTFAVDGKAVTTMRTAIKPFVGTGVHGQFGVSVGALIAPGTLATGAHSLETGITTPDGGLETLVVTFTLSPTACG